MAVDTRHLLSATCADVLRGLHSHAAADVSSRASELTATEAQSRYMARRRTSTSEQGGRMMTDFELDMTFRSTFHKALRRDLEPVAPM